MAIKAHLLSISRNVLYNVTKILCINLKWLCYKILLLSIKGENRCIFTTMNDISMTG